MRPSTFSLCSVVCVTVLVVVQTAEGQAAPPIQWTKCLGGSGADAATCIRQTNDSGFIVAGYNYSHDGDVTRNHGNSDYWVVKLSGTGTLQWEKSLGGSDDEVAEAIEQTSDSGFIIAGWSNSADGDVTGHHGSTTRSDYWIVKLTATGNIQWEKSLGGSGDEAAESIRQTSDGGYIVAGFSDSHDGDVTQNMGSADYWIVKLSGIGNIEWEKSFGGTDADEASAIRQTTDGGYIVAGYVYSVDGDVTGHHGDAGSDDYWIVKLSSTGSLQWEKSLGGIGGDWTSSIEQTTDGGYVVAGSSYSDDGDVTAHHGTTANSDAWIVKLSATGDIQWEDSLGGMKDEEAKSIQQTSDSGYIVAGYSYSNDGDVTGNHGSADYWIVKLSPTGTIQWQESLGGTDYEEAWSVGQTLDSGGYVLAGYTRSLDDEVAGNHGGMDCWIAKLGYIPPPKIGAPHVIDFGSLLCDSTRTKSFEVHNTGGDTLVISDTVLNEMPWMSFVITSSASFPIFIAPGDSTLFLVAFTSAVTGVQTATLSIFSNDTAHNPWPIELIGRRDTVGILVGGRTRDTLNFGCVPIGAGQDSVVELTNISTVPATFLMLTTNASAFTLPVQSASFNTAGDKQSIVVHFDGTNTAGSYTGYFITTDTCSSQDTVYLEAFVGSVPPLTIALQTNPSPTTVGTERRVYVLANLLSSVTSGISFDVTNEPTALQFDSVSSACGTSVVLGVNSNMVTFNVCSVLSSDTVATLFYQTLVGSTLSPTITLQDVSTVNACNTVSGMGSVTINLLPPGCELGTVVVHPFTSAIQSIYPNPVSGITTIVYSTIEDATVRLNIYDALGRIVRSLVNSERKPGVYSTSFDTEGLANGIFYLGMWVVSFWETKELLMMK